LIPDPRPIRALLDPSHETFAAEAAAFAARRIEANAAPRVIFHSWHDQ
jgi:hypothetical protein